MSLKIGTLNLLIDLDQWEFRGPLIVKEISELSPDLILFQEVSTCPNNVEWIASQLQGYQVYLAPDAGMKIGCEGLAIMTRLPVDEHIILDLGPQNRKAQVLLLTHKGQPYAITNTHLFWRDGFAPERLEQAKQIINYLNSLPEDTQLILAGDFNAEPNSPTIKFIKQSLNSTYEVCHGNEPTSTFPTPLQRSNNLEVIKENDQWKLKKQVNLKIPKNSTIDYIFSGFSLRPSECHVVFNNPDPNNDLIYPSDHYGLLAIF